MRYSIKHTIAWLVPFSQLFVACAHVPDLQEEQRPPQLHEIVNRIQCDLYDALSDRLNQPFGYEWLHSWTAQANLNYIVNEQSQLTPGVVITDPTKIVSIPNKISNFAESWSLGLGAQDNGTATRNDTLSFTVSMDELRHRFGKPGHSDCASPSGTGLRSELGLKDWVSSSLSPADDNQLDIGFHKVPKVGAGTIAVKAAIARFTGPSTGTSGACSVKAVPGTKVGARTAAAEALGLFICDLFVLTDSRTFKFDQLDGHQIDYLIKTIHDAQNAIKLRIPQSGVDSINQEIEDIAVLLSAFVDPPVDTIAHQVQFVVVWGANASPGWTLVKFKGPSPSTGSLISGMSTKTNTLNVVLGSPSSVDAQSAVNALQIGTAVANSINSTPR